MFAAQLQSKTVLQQKQTIAQLSLPSLWQKRLEPIAQELKHGQVEDGDQQGGSQTELGVLRAAPQ